MADVVYDNFKKNVMNGTLNLASDNITVMLVTSTYTPAQATHEFKSSVTGEVVGTGYTARGAVLSAKSVTASGGKGIFTAANVTWPTSTITARGAVVYEDTGVDATSALICYIDFLADKSSSAGNFTISWNAGGIVTLT